jgi:hypothetical protein
MAADSQLRSPCSLFRGPNPASRPRFRAVGHISAVQREPCGKIRHHEFLYGKEQLYRSEEVSEARTSVEGRARADLAGGD